ncbi:MAG TPA: hypothetical protein VKG21_02125 [Casimicrobiaceae bacterium]|nr:hypothetical protein [Casimicrobiaceae bacterium]
MILGMSTSTFTLLHVVLSLIGIAAGFIVVAGMLASRKLDGWTGLFLLTTILTSVTGYFFPVDRVLPSHIVGALSLAVLVIAVLAFYRYRLQGSWRWIYVVTALVALYLNVFVGVVQAFQKIPLLNSLAPQGSEPPFIIAQVIVLVALIAIGVVALRSFHPGTQAPELRAVKT